MKRNESLRTFNGAVAIVTGGASGIGRALAEALARRGARVVMADLQFEMAGEVAARIRENGGEANAKELDVTNFPATKRLVEDTFQTLGRLDYIFNNAGIGIVGEARLYELEDWYRVLDCRSWRAGRLSDHAPAEVRAYREHGLCRRFVSLSALGGLFRHEARGRRSDHVPADRGGGGRGSRQRPLPGSCADASPH